MYIIEPRKTMPAPDPSCVFQPLPNHQTLKHRLIALRVVRTRFVETEERRCSRWIGEYEWRYKKRRDKRN